MLGKTSFINKLHLYFYSIELNNIAWNNQNLGTKKKIMIITSSN